MGGSAQGPGMASLPPPPSTPSQKTNFYLFYYGVIVIGSIAVVLAVYNLSVLVGRCGRHRRRTLQRSNQTFGDTSLSSINPNRHLLSTFKYRKEGENLEQVSDNECAVCLSAFEEGEDVRQLSRCKHSFHAPCIDMWLYSHSNCPLCRASVESPAPFQLMPTQEENPREGLLESGRSV